MQTPEQYPDDPTIYRYEIRYRNGQRERFLTRREWGKVQDAYRNVRHVVSVRKVGR